jgi:hypothetical protein
MLDEPPLMVRIVVSPDFIISYKRMNGNPGSLPWGKTRPVPDLTDAVQIRRLELPAFPS